MRAILNQARIAAAQQSSSRAQTRTGIITSYDPSAYAVKVKIQPEDTEIGWLPLTSPYVGNGWGLAMGPSIGDAVTVHFTEGGFEAGQVGMRHYSDEDRPPTCPAGEVHLVHKSGSLIRMLSNGDVEIITSAGMHITAPTTTVTGNLTVTGQTNVQGGLTCSGGGAHTADFQGVIKATQDVIANTVSLHDHRHGGVQTGGGNTGAPTP